MTLLARRISPIASTLFAYGPAVRAMGILGLALLLGHAARAQTILGSTGSYAVMAGSTVTINGATTINGNLGAANIAGAGSVTYTPTGASVGAITVQNQTDFTKAFNGLAAMPVTRDLSGLILGTTAGAIILTPGVYKFTSTAQLTGTLTLDAQNQSNAFWVFQIGTTLDTAAGAKVVFTNLAANSVANDGLFWQVGSTTVLGADTTFEGNVLGGTTFTIGANATINHGRVLTGTDVMTFAGGNTIDFIAADSGYSGGLAFDGGGSNIVAVPEPATTSLLIAGFSGLFIGFRRIRRKFSAR
ncbi:MAG: ice-binding family protein [Opitutaceae bacterium]|jgi:type VI secretion system secreted protein VgrG